MERLAQRLGMGSRHLTRLFARYLQASPSKVARTARVQRAKRLLDETSLPMTEIAMRAGGLREPATVQLRLCRNLRQAADRDSPHAAIGR